jgi:CRISPR-associated protein Csy3
MNTQNKTFAKLPGVLAFQRGFAVSDALFINYFEDEVPSEKPLMVVRHGIRGTQNVSGSGSKEGTTQDAQKREVSNIQITDTAKLDPDCSKFLCRFSLRYNDLKDCYWSCAPGKSDTDEFLQDFKKSIQDFIKRAKDGKGIDEIARRFARNILNGRWLWRNRIIANTIEIRVILNESELCKANAYDLPRNNFLKYTQSEMLLGEKIAEGLRGTEKNTFVIEAFLDIGFGGVEVFPSQNYIEQKPKGFARSLYYIKPGIKTKNFDTGLQNKVLGIEEKGQAALRDQKVSNAIRTIDTWYSDDDVVNPIAVEPNGASLEDQVFYRSVKKKNTAFKLLGKLNDIDVESGYGMFMTAVMIRGGVLGEGEEKADKKTQISGEE